MAREANMDGGMVSEVERMLNALRSQWGRIPLVKGNMEANFARLMAPTYTLHQYDPAEMLAVMKDLMSGFDIDLPEDEGEFVKVALDNLRMSLFLLWCALDEAPQIRADSAIRFVVGEKHRAKAEVFFDGIICVDARLLDKHRNLKRFLAEGAEVVVYVAAAV
jgi:hypothetical protein